MDTVGGKGVRPSSPLALIVQHAESRACARGRRHFEPNLGDLQCVGSRHRMAPSCPLRHVERELASLQGRSASGNRRRRAWPVSSR